MGAFELILCQTDGTLCQINHLMEPVTGGCAVMPCNDRLPAPQQFLMCGGCAYAERGEPEQRACEGMSPAETLIALSEMGLRVADMFASRPDVNSCVDSDVNLR